MTGFFIFLFLLQCTVLGGFCAFVAREKDRNTLGWFFLGFFFSLIALLAICGVGRDRSNPKEYDRSNPKEYRDKKEKLDLEFS